MKNSEVLFWALAILMVAFLLKLAKHFGTL